MSAVKKETLIYFFEQFFSFTKLNYHNPQVIALMSNYSCSMVRELLLKILIKTLMHFFRLSLPAITNYNDVCINTHFPP